MRRTIISLALAGVLAAAGCSDSDVGGEAAGQPSGDDFCADFEELDERFSADPDATSDDVVEALADLEPPDEIADDFEVVVDSVRALAELDPADPEDAAEAQTLSEEAADAQDRLTEYLETECEVDLGS